MRNRQLPPIPEPDGILTLSVSLSNGKFDASLQFPLEVGLEANQKYIDRWLELIATALNLGIENMSADLGKVSDGN